MKFKTLGRVTKVSLFCDLVKTPNFGTIIDECRYLWDVRDLLDYYHAHLLNSKKLRSDTPIELIILRVAEMAQNQHYTTFETFTKELTDSISNLSLEVRASIKQASANCFVRLWRKMKDAA
jgi:hypothetical protein